MKNIRQSGRLPKYSSSSVLFPPCRSRDLVAERCQMTGVEQSYLHYRWILNKCQVQGRRHMEDMDNEILHAVTWQLISRDAWQAAAKSNHQCPWEDRVHAKGGGERGCMGRKPESIFKSGAWAYISCNQRIINFVFGQIIYRRERRAST